MVVLVVVPTRRETTTTRDDEGRRGTTMGALGFLKNLVGGGKHDRDGKTRARARARDDEGEWVDDKVHGRGVSIYSSGNR